MESHVIVELSRPQDAVLNSRKSLILDMSGQGGGKTGTIAYSSGQLISQFPKANGFIGANTHEQLSSSTFAGVFKVWERVFGWTEYQPHINPSGEYVVGKMPPAHFLKPTKLKLYNNAISFREGTVIFTGSLENYKAHDGKEFTWAHLDETKDTKEEALTDVILGRLRQIGLWFDQDGDLFWETNIERAQQMGGTAWNPCYIHTSPAIGVADWINEMFNLNAYEEEMKESAYLREKAFFHKEFKNKAVIQYSSFHNKKHLPPNYLENQILNQKAAKADKVVYGLPFSKSGGEYYPSFERRDHVKPTLFIPQLPVHLTLDFNVVPFVTLLAIQIEKLTRYIDSNKNKFDDWVPGLLPIDVTRIRQYKEYCLASPRNSTEAACEAFDQDHADEAPEVFYYGDASGLSRIPGLGSLTNFKILEQKLVRYLHNLSKRVKAPNVAPLKRRDLLDNIFAGKYPEIEIVIDKSCKTTIKDIEKVKQGMNGKVKKRVTNPETKETYEEYGHPTDALEYLVTEIFKDYLRTV